MVVLDVRLYQSRKGMGAPGPRSEKPWLSIILPKEALRLGSPLSALSNSLTSLGFTELGGHV